MRSGWMRLRILARQDRVLYEYFYFEDYYTLEKGIFFIVIV